VLQHIALNALLGRLQEPLHGAPKDDAALQALAKTGDVLLQFEISLGA